MALTKTKEKAVNSVVLIEIDQIHLNPAQPRMTFSQDQLRVLADSIRENGLLQPITVRKNFRGLYELISGERRMRAYSLLGYREIPCIVIEKSDRESAVLALIENIHREDLDMFEQALALKKLISEWNVTQEEAALKLGMAQSTLANKIRLLKLSYEEQQIILENNLTERHARALLRLDDEISRLKVIKEIIAKNLTVAQTDKYITNLGKSKKNQKRVHIIKDLRLFNSTINKAVKIMKEAGIRTVVNQKEYTDCVEYIIRIDTT